jgi:hypothetical protein
MHQILQAGCRGKPRQMVGRSCPPARLFVVASKRSGIRDLLPVIFPGSAKPLSWNP